MAKNDKDENQGRAVTLPNGKKRIEYIRDQFYNKGKTRSEIKTDINEQLEKANRTNEQIPYQIVFAATKTKEDPRIASAKKAEERAATKAKKDAEKAAQKEKDKKAKEKADKAKK